MYKVKMTRLRKKDTSAWTKTLTSWDGTSPTRFKIRTKRKSKCKRRMKESKKTSKTSSTSTTKARWTTSTKSSTFQRCFEAATVGLT
jgi:hypothetical protein